MAISFRDQARDSLKRAKAEMASQEENRLKYAALELRLAMESLTFARAELYKDDLPPSEYRTWQPRKLLAVLLEIDPYADQGGTLFMGIEESPGTEAKEMSYLGKEVVLSMAILKRHYDAIGNFLHMPTLKQRESGSGISLNKLRERCVEVAAYIEEATSSTLFNTNLKVTTQIKCQKCQEFIIRRFPPSVKEMEATCFNCNATYHVAKTTEGQVLWQIKDQEIECRNEKCNHKTRVLERDITIGKYWKCPTCKGTNEFMLGVRYQAPDAPKRT